MRPLFDYLIFPGFLFTILIGLTAGWVDRKLSARLQWRVGPPWHQNFTDIVKLMGKEVIIPENAGRRTFILAPYLGLVSSILVSAILGKALLDPFSGFSGDLIIVVYLLIIPAIAFIVGASASANPLASLGASREIKLLLGYELPFILAIVTIIIKSSGAIQLNQIISNQNAVGSYIVSFSGTVAFIVALLCTQAKLCITPFDISEAEQELMGGTLIEYSGLPLAIFKLTKAALLYAMPVMLSMLFLGKDLSPLFIIAKFIGILVIIILIKNTNPRVRIDQALKFFWGPVTLLAVLAMILAIFGI